MRAPSLFCVVLALLFLAQPALSVFYLPGVAPYDYKEGENVPLLVNKLTSVHTQIPYKYYWLPFCKPPKKSLDDKPENIGEILRGDRIESSLYEIQAKKSFECKSINSKAENPDKCTNFNKEDLKRFEDKVKYDYRVHWIVDNMPAATIHSYKDGDGETSKLYETGFALGMKSGPESGTDAAAKKDTYYINNHVNIKILYSDSPKDAKDPNGVRVIGFEVLPESREYVNVQDFIKDGRTDCPTTTGQWQYQQISEKESAQILWTYSVQWQLTQTKWMHRWDDYLANTDSQIHWFSIINSLMIVLFLTGMVAMIMMRTLRADVRRYNSMEPNEEAEETGWKLVHGDVFRPPRRPMLLAVLIGSGVQVFGMTVITMVFAVLGFLSPANRGMLVTAVVVLFVVMGVFAGYFSTRAYKTFKGVHWKKNTIMTAFAFPGVILAIFFIIDLFMYGQKSSSGVPVGTVFSIIALWCGISVPLVFFGSYFAFKKPLPDDPVRTNQIPRQIPEQVWYMSPLLSILMGGILPFGAIFIELFFILSAIWGYQFYYIFGVLFIVFIILVLTCAEITIVMCYFQLCAEDYRWWWRSYLTAGASALYMFLYSIFYFFTKLEIEKFVSALIYFAYTLIMAICFFVLTGTIGFYACLWFVRKIYGSIKVD